MPCAESPSRVEFEFPELGYSVLEQVVLYMHYKVGGLLVGCWWVAGGLLVGCSLVGCC